MRCAAAALFASVVFAGAIPFAFSQTAPATQRLVLVELFTSEGCSSCPPADALLRKINGYRTESGQTIVGISEHVTYWNNQGWADPFSQETYTERQNAYGRRFTLDSVFTPQVVVNGEKEVLGSDGAAILKAVTASKGAASLALHIDSVANSASAKTMEVTFSVTGRIGTPVDVFAVVADDAAKSSVLRGENSGRTLEHVSVARSFAKVATVKDARSVTVSVPIPGLVQGQPATGRHLIVFAQERGFGRVVAIESRPL